MAKHTVEIVEAFEVRTQMGALTVTAPRTGQTDVIDGPREHVFQYPVGKQATFYNKKDAEAFCKAHGTKVKYLGKI